MCKMSLYCGYVQLFISWFVFVLSSFLDYYLWLIYFFFTELVHLFMYYFYCCCSVAKSCSALCNPTDCSMPGFPVLHYFLNFAQTQVHWIGDAIQPSHPLPPSSPFAFNLSQHQGLFQWVSSLHQVAKVLEFQLQHQSFQWIFRIDFL